MDNSRLSPDEVIAMPLNTFKETFGFVPRDAIEKKWFAVTAKRITPIEYQAIKAGILGDYDTDNVNMELT